MTQPGEPAEPRGPLRAVVDREECFGFANCADLLPSVFALDEDGISVPADVDADEALLAQAVDNCPRSAISLVRRASEKGHDTPAETGAESHAR